MIGKRKKIKYSDNILAIFSLTCYDIVGNKVGALRDDQKWSSFLYLKQEGTE